jgi:S-adenosylmethionine decarboxylase
MKYFKINQINYLDLAFPNNEYDTAGYVIGKVNGDHWCLYLATPLQEAKKRDVHIQNDQDDDDITLEILMQDLDQDAMKEFWRTNEEVTESRLPHNIKLQKHILKDPKRIYVY